MPTKAKQKTPKPPNASLVRKTSHLTAKMINGATTAIRKRVSKRSIRCLNRLGVVFSINDTPYYSLFAKSVKLGAASSSMMAGVSSFAMALLTTSCFASTPPAMRITSFFVLADALLFNT